VAIQAQGGGAEKVSLTLHQEFIKNHQARIVYMYPDLPFEGSNQENLNIPRLKIVGIPLGVVRLARISRRFKPDVTLIHCEPAMLLACLTPFLGKLVVVEHQVYKWRGIKGIVVRFTFRILKIRRAYTVHLRKSRVLTDRSVYIPNPITIPETKVLSTANRLPLELIWIGRLSWQKGFDRLPRILYESKTKVIHIYGSGSLEGKLNFEGTTCKYYGFRTAVWENLPDNPLLLITSRWEGDGLVILEALIRQIPLLIINFPEIDELPIPKSCICSDETEMTNKILDIQSGLLGVEGLVNHKAKLIIERSRGPIEISQRYLNFFKRVLE